MPPVGFDWDIFISYAHIDNTHFSDIPHGWIDVLHERLDIRLAQLLGQSPRIWRDRKLSGNDVFNDTIKKELAKAAIFVAVLSPRYLESSSCRAEVADFTRFAEQQGGLRVSNKHRVFKVVKTDIPIETHPAEWQGLLGYEFYEKDSASGRVREFDHLLMGSQRDKRYWDKLEDLAWDITKTLTLLQKNLSPLPLPETQSQLSPALQPMSKASGSTIYLAETTSDLSAERDSIKRELQQYGHRVVPDQMLPLHAPTLEQAVREYLRQAALSIHLIGMHYGIIPEMELSRSSVRLQLDLAAERGNDPNFSRVIWMPPGLQSADERQQALIDELQRNSQAGSELLQIKLEDVKTIIHAKLAPKPASATNGHEERGLPSVYLICDKQDYDDTKSLEDFLNDQGITVLPSPFEGDESQFAQYHKESLQLCDAVLIYYGRVSDTWAQLKRLELLKLAGVGRDRPLLAKAFYLSAPTTIPKDRFRCPYAIVMRNYQGFDAATLAPFLAQLQQAGRALR
jgi:hypothetical protein